MNYNYTTPRLLLNELTLSDALFIAELVNTPEWIQFIGNRNINSLIEANEYVQKIIDNPTVNYWVVKLKDQEIPIGIITFIKREYLDHHDIGFAFLHQYTQKGYAYEAALAVLNDLAKHSNHQQILATTVKDNSNSIQLLEKLGLRFWKEIERENETLLVYAITSDKILINQITKQFFSLFTNKNKQQTNLDIIYELCLAEAIIIKKDHFNETVYGLNSFIEPRKIILTNGTLTEFEEIETNEETKIVGQLAQRYSRYQKNGYLNSEFFNEYGTKLFQFVKTNNGWKINSIIWEDDEYIK